MMMTRCSFSVVWRAVVVAGGSGGFRVTTTRGQNGSHEKLCCSLVGQLPDMMVVAQRTLGAADTEAAWGAALGGASTPAHPTRPPRIGHCERPPCFLFRCFLVCII